MLKASFSFVFLLLVASQAVLSESIEEDVNSSVKNQDEVVLTRQVRQILRAGARNGNPLNLQGVPATRLGIVGGMRLNSLGFPMPGILRAPSFVPNPQTPVATVGLSRATALPIIGSPFVASSPLGAANLGSSVGSIGRTGAPAVLPAAGGSSLAFRRKLGAAASPSATSLRSTVGTLERTRGGAPAPAAAVGGVRVGSTRFGVVSGAKAIEPNVMDEDLMGPVATGVAIPRASVVSPILTAPGIPRAGRLIRESDEEVEKSPELISKLQAALKTQMPDHHRVKRQYFKPSIDGSMLSNDRSYLLKASNESKPSTTTVATSSLTDPTKKPKITVAGLIHSLFQLFDRIKSVLKKALDEHESE